MVSNFYSSYFNGVEELYHFQKNDASKNALALIKVVSYITLIFPFLVAVVYGGSLLFGRCFSGNPRNLSPESGKAEDIAKQSLMPSFFESKIDRLSTEVFEFALNALLDSQEEDAPEEEESSEEGLFNDCERIAKEEVGSGWWPEPPVSKSN